MAHILVFNSGSSSVKFSVYETRSELNLVFDGELSGIATPHAQIVLDTFDGGTRVRQSLPIKPETMRTYSGAVQAIFSVLERPEIPKPDAIGHRVVHSGPHLSEHQRITSETLKLIEQASALAPLHESIAVQVIGLSKDRYPGIDQYACFDTVFHHSMPESASCYPLPEALRKQGIRKYGFHGLSCESILAQFKGGASSSGLSGCILPKRLIIAHLGGGSSLTAVREGRSVDTTMGLTPCGGVLMGTRSGDLDPGLVFYLLRNQPIDSVNPIESLERELNMRSGLLALSGYSKDMREIREASVGGNTQCAFAIEVFVASLKKAIGGLIAILGGIDALVFTGGIGENDSCIRAEVCDGLQIFGISIDARANSDPSISARSISPQSSPTQVYVLPAEEDRIIASHIVRLRANP